MNGYSNSVPENEKGSTMTPAESLYQFCETSVVILAFVKVTLDAALYLLGKSSLHLVATQRSGYAGAMGPMVGIRRTETQLSGLCPCFFTSALLEFPAVHS